jgi:hypothetical protein
MVVQADMGINQEHIWKITRTKSVGGMTQEVECLPSKLKPWVQTPVLEGKKEHDKNWEDDSSFDKSKFSSHFLYFNNTNVT